MKTTILIAVFAMFMASQAKAESVEYRLSVYVLGVLKKTAVYSTMDGCIEAGSVYSIYLCEPVKGGM